MNNQKHIKYLFILILLILTLSLTACGASVEKLNKRGNEAYIKQMYEEALVAYQAAQIESPELAEPYYNAANTLYRQGNYAEAVKQLSYALSFADDESIKQSGLYNLGNNAYNSQELEPAVEAYKEALLIDAYDQDAKYNLELALQQQEQQQQQEQEQQENQEQNQDQDSEGENSQENEDQNEDGENQEDQSQSDDNQQEGEQNHDSESSEDQEGEEGQNKDQSEQQNEEDQEDQEDQNDQEQGEGQPQDQESDNQDQNEQEGQVPAPGERMTAEQAEQLLAAIAQDMETLQERLGQVLFVQDLPPIQDW